MRRTLLFAMMVLGFSCGGDKGGSLRAADTGLADVSLAPGDAGDVGCDLPCGHTCCETGQACDRLSGICVCVPETCSSLGWSCGESDDGCGNPLDCGDCPAGQICTSTGVCGACTPDPVDELCGQMNRSCGTTTTPDNCGVSRTINCGKCPIGQTCQADGNCAP